MCWGRREWVDATRYIWMMFPFRKHKSVTSSQHFLNFAWCSHSDNKINQFISKEGVPPWVFYLGA